MVRSKEPGTGRKEPLVLFHKCLGIECYNNEKCKKLLYIKPILNWRYQWFRLGVLHSMHAFCFRAYRYAGVVCSYCIKIWSYLIHTFWSLCKLKYISICLPLEKLRMGRTTSQIYGKLPNAKADQWSIYLSFSRGFRQKSLPALPGEAGIDPRTFCIQSIALPRSCSPSTGKMKGGNDLRRDGIGAGQIRVETLKKLPSV